MASDEDTEEYRRKLQRMPKAELHVHLDGSVRPETMLSLAEGDIPMPATDPEALREYMHVRDARHLGDYLARFEITLAVMQTGEALERIAFELAEDLAHENVKYAEIRFSPLLNTRRGLTNEQAVEAPLRGLRRAAEAYGIRTSLIICGLRHLDPSVNLDLAELAVSYRDRGVVGFDLAGAEDGHPAGDHAAAFAAVRAHDLGITIHAGEAAGAESIRQAVHDCGARRIGHGTRLPEDPRLAEYVRDFRIPIEVCLTSNVQTRAVREFGEHPLRRLYDAGMVLSINTDNRLMSATTLTDEYWRAHRHLGFDLSELAHISLMGFASAFVPLPEKMEMIGHAMVEMKRQFGEGVLEAAGRGRLLI